MGYSNKPELNFWHIGGGASILFGMLFIIIAIHVAAIGEDDAAVADVLSTTFSVSLTIYITLIILAIVGVVIQLARVLTWYATTPDWIKLRVKKGGK